MKSPLAPLASQDSIRLLKLQEGSREDPIACHVDNFELINAPSYSALSYTWDAARNEELKADLVQNNKPPCIKLNEGVAEISPNLQSALLQLREEAYLDYLWVDSICINQSDDVEKASQITMMGEIFSTAKEVIVWLGPESASSNGFRWVHEDFGSKLVQYHDIKPTVMNEDWAKTLADEAFDGYRFEENRDMWEDYQTFYSEHRWFGRAWIIQELSLARNIIIKVGSIAMSWYLMAFVGQWVTHSRLSDTLRTPTDIKTLGAEVVLLDAVRTLCQDELITSPSSGLTALKLNMTNSYGPMTDFQICLSFMMDTIIKFRQAKATDPRDKIFCVFGLFQRFHKVANPSPQDVPALVDPQGSEDMSSIYPSYKLSTEQVFTNFTAFLIQKLPHLTILSDVEDDTRRVTPNLPSWVPDYNSLVGSRSFTWGFPHCDYNVSMEDPTYGYPSPRHISGNVLTLRGYILDKAEVICPAMASCKTSERRDWLMNICVLLSSYIEVLNSLQVYYRGSQSRLEALWRTVIADQFEEAPASSKAGKIFHLWVCYTATLSAKMVADPRSIPGYTNLILQLKRFENNAARRESKLVYTMPNGQEIHAEPLTDYAVSPYTLPSVTEVIKLLEMLDRELTTQETENLEFFQACFTRFEVAMGYVHMDRRLYKTETGLLGLGPLSMQAGDEVWLLCDGKIPVVLRPSTTSDGYRLVGDSYVHGFMHGEISKTEDWADKICDVKIS